MLLLRLNETMDSFAIVSSAHWHHQVLRRVDGHVLRTALEFEVEGLTKKGRPKRAWNSQFKEERMKVGLSRKVLDFRQTDTTVLSLLLSSKLRVDIFTSTF